MENGNMKFSITREDGATSIVCEGASIASLADILVISADDDRIAAALMAAASIVKITSSTERKNRLNFKAVATIMNYLDEKAKA